MRGLRSLQNSSRINWSDPLTRGLRNVIIPAQAGIQDIIPDIVDQRCSAYVTSGVNSNSTAFAREDLALINNQYIPVTWGLQGPLTVFDYDKDFSLFVRSNLQAAGVAWTVIQAGTVAYGRAFGINGQDNANTVVFGNWTGPGLDSGVIDDGVPVHDRFSPVLFTWNGTTKEWCFYKNESMIGPKVFIGTPAFGPIGDASSPWGFSGDLWGYLALVSHVYMWEAEVQPADAMRLMYNPGAIFGSPDPTRFRGYEAPPPPVPIVLDAEAGAFVLAGQDATLSHDLVLNAEAGAFVLTGQDATLSGPLGTITLDAEAGAFVLAGQAATLELGPIPSAKGLKIVISDRLAEG